MAVERHPRSIPKSCSCSAAPSFRRRCSSASGSAPSSAISRPAWPSAPPPADHRRRGDPARGRARHRVPAVHHRTGAQAVAAMGPAARRSSASAWRRCWSPAACSGWPAWPAARAGLAGRGRSSASGWRCRRRPLRCRSSSRKARPMPSSARRRSRSCCSRIWRSCRLLALIPLFVARLRRRRRRPACSSSCIAIGAIAALLIAGRYLHQSAVPDHRQYRRQGGDDRRGTARGARVRDADAARRPVDGDGRLRGRRDACRILLPARARSRHRAVPRHPARPVLHGRRPVAGPRRGHRQLGD